MCAIKKLVKHTEGCICFDRLGCAFPLLGLGKVDLEERCTVSSLLGAVRIFIEMQSRQVESGEINESKLVIIKIHNSIFNRP